MEPAVQAVFIWSILYHHWSVSPPHPEIGEKILEARGRRAIHSSGSGPPWLSKIASLTKLDRAFREVRRSTIVSAKY
jgi:hypothetical protein